MTKTRNLNPSIDSTASPVFDYAPLVQAAASGDRPAMERLLMRAQEVAFRFSVLVCGHAGDAEDVMQEALLKTYRYVSKIRDPAAFRTWLYRTVRNACLMNRRRRVDEPSRFEPLEPGDDGHERGSASTVADTGRLPDDIAINRWLGRRLKGALASLPSSFRVIVLLREVEGLSTREVAQVTGLSEANVKTRLHRARLMLRDLLEDV